MMITMTDLQELYIAFKRINGKKVTKEPLYRVDSTPILEGLTEAINQPTNKTLLTKRCLIAMKEHLERDNGLYYYMDDIQVPFRIDNSKYIAICERLLRQSGDDYD